MIFAVLSQKYRTHKSILNHNNEIGLCQTMFNMPDDTEFLVVEFGMRGLGEIELLSKYAEPDVAVITNIGTAHIGRLGSIENIAKAKCEITSHLNPKGMLIAYKSDLAEKVCNWNGKKIFYGDNYKIVALSENFTEFIYKNNSYKLNVNGEFNVINSIAAIEIALGEGMTPEEIKIGLENYLPVGERGRIVEINENIKIIADFYNANPDSMKASINSTLSSYKDREIVFVLGNMGELGNHEKELHENIGEFLSSKTFNSLITVGEKAKLIANKLKNTNILVKSFENTELAGEYLAKNLPENSVVLLKASRSMKFENILQAIELLQNSNFIKN